jgi:hypothetical protein
MEGEEKDIDLTLERIENFKKEKAFKILSEGFPINNCIATLKYIEAEGFECKIFLEEIPRQEGILNKLATAYGVQEEFYLGQSNEYYKIPKDSISKLSATAFVEPQVLTALYKNILSNKDQAKFENCFFRFVVPNATDVNFSEFERCKLKIKNTITYALLKLTINGIKTHVFRYSDKGGEYLIIDTLERVNISVFKNAVHNFLLALGFFIGNLYQKEFFFLTSEDGQFKDNVDVEYVIGEDSVITNSCLIDGHKFSQIVRVFKKQELMNDFPPIIKSSVVETLVDALAEEEQLRRTITLLIEGNQTKFSVLKAGIFSIALETITDFIYNKNKDKVDPIVNEELSEKIKKVVTNEVSKYKNSIGEYGMQILQAKINDLNSPTNSKKLTKPFEILGIKLLNSDIEYLKERNKFLHGQKPKNVKDFESEDRVLRYNFTILTLIHCLILKLNGYRGHVLNLASWYDAELGKKPAEPFLRILN